MHSNNEPSETLPASSIASPREMAFIEALRAPFLLLDEALRVLYINAMGREQLRIFGYDPGSMLGVDIWTVFPGARGTQVEDAFAQAWESGDPAHVKYYHPKTAQYVEVDVARQGNALGVFWRDLGVDRQRSVTQANFEAELLSSRRQLEEFIALAPLAIIVLDNELRVVTWNLASERMFQWTAEEVLGQFLPTVPDAEVAALEQMRSRERRGESISGLPARRRRKDGVVLDVQISTSPLFDASASVIGVIGMITDVTALRKLELQLRTAQKMEAVGLLAGGVAHDFNNLLTAIKGFASLLQIMVSDGGRADEFLAEINKAADRAAALTAQLLAFSRRQLLRPESIDLNARVRDLEPMLSLLLRENAELRLALNPSLGSVLADPGQIEQVILNLVLNARDAVQGRTAGCVTIATSNAELREEFAEWGVSGAPGEYVRLDVTDNGVGIDAATQARIFDPFFTTKAPGHGTGLGLATVYGIVKQSGGYVWVNSRVGSGSTFSVYLPRSRTPHRTSGPTTLSVLGGAERILLVEDDAAVRTVARRTLQLYGYQVVEAADGESAIEKAQQHTIELLVTDVMMPGMLGPEVATALRSVQPDIAVLFMSGHAEEIARDGLLDPATPFLPKPFTPSQLAGKVREVLDQSAAPSTGDAATPS